MGRVYVVQSTVFPANDYRVVTLDLHASQIQGFFRIPVDDLHTMPVLCKAVTAMGLEDLVVVSPDIGFAKQARNFSRRLGTSLAIAEKERSAHDERAEVLELIGEVDGCTALLVPD